MELFKNTNFDFLGKKWPFIIMSLILTAAGVVSFIAKCGPRDGIDFRGCALVTVRFAQRPPVDKVRSALSGKLPVEVQEVTENNQDDLIGTDVSSDQALEQARGTMINSLNAAFGQPQSGKLDINNTGKDALADRLRDPLQRAGAGLNDQQLASLTSAIADYRTHNGGLIRNLDDLAHVPGMTPAALNVIKQECYASPFTILSVEIVGPRVGAELQRKALLAVMYALGGMLVYIAFRFEWIYGFAAVIAV